MPKLQTHTPESICDRICKHPMTTVPEMNEFVTRLRNGTVPVSTKPAVVQATANACDITLRNIRAVTRYVVQGSGGESPPRAWVPTHRLGNELHGGKGEDYIGIRILVPTAPLYDHENDVVTDVWGAHPDDFNFVDVPGKHNKQRAIVPVSTGVCLLITRRRVPRTQTTRYGQAPFPEEEKKWVYTTVLMLRKEIATAVGNAIPGNTTESQ